MASAQSTRRGGGQLAATIALSSALAIGAFTLLAPVIRAITPVTHLPAPLPDHHQDGETLLFVIAFAVLLPLGIFAGMRLASRVATGPNSGALAGLAGALTALLAVVLIVARLTSEVMLSAGSALWLAVALAALLRAASAKPWPAGERLAAWASGLWAIAALLCAGAALAFTTIDSISWPLLVVGLATVAAFLVVRERVTLPFAGRRLGVAADLIVVGLLLLAVPNVVIFGAGGGAADAFQTTIIQFHQNFFLGPANQVLHGEPMLVDTLSQYGVGSILFLAGLFDLIPIGNGTLGLIEGVLSALMFIGAWATLRIAGVSRLLAAATMTVAVIVLVYGLVYPLGGLLQHGAIRFGLPIGVAVGAVGESRWPGAAAPFRLLQLTTVAVASIWALEAFAYVMLTAVAVAAMYVFLAPGGTRRRQALRWAAQVVGACLVAHVVFALATLLAAGELPDWGWYLNTLREFLFGQVGDLTYDFSPWSPGLALGGIYVVSAAALVVVLLRRPDVAVRQRTLLIAIGVMTAFGVALFTYIVNRSADHIIPYVSLPAVSLGALWLTLLGRGVLAVPARGRRFAWGLALGLAALLVAVAASSVSLRFEQSALGHARPGGASLRAALDRLWDPPALRPDALAGQSLLDAYMADETKSSVLTSADLSVEILLRTERGSAIPLGDPWEDSLVPDDYLDDLGAYVDGLEPGDRLLIDAPAREAFQLYRSQPTLDPLNSDPTKGEIVPSGLAVLQLWTLKEIGKRYDLRTVESSPSGLEVVELVPRTTK